MNSTLNKAAADKLASPAKWKVQVQVPPSQKYLRAITLPGSAAQLSRIDAIATAKWLARQYDIPKPEQKRVKRNGR